MEKIDVLVRGGEGVSKYSFDRATGELIEYSLSTNGGGFKYSKHEMPERLEIIHSVSNAVDEFLESAERRISEMGPGLVDAFYRR